MDSKCQTMNAVLDCPVTLLEPRKIYFEGELKKRYYNHKKSLNHKQYSHETTLSR